MRTTARFQSPSRPDGGPLGKAIAPHRSISHLNLPWRRVIGGVLIAMAFTLTLMWLQQNFVDLWTRQILWWMRTLPLEGQLDSAHPVADRFLTPAMPAFNFQIRALGPLEPLLHILFSIALWVGTAWFPDDAKPAAFLLRFGIIIHIASASFFQIWPESFPHSVMNHVAVGLQQAWALMLLTPWLHLFTFYVFPLATWHRISLTVLTLAFLFTLAPLLYVSHIVLLVKFGLIVMPVLHFLFGVMVFVLGFVALYGWGMSWHNQNATWREE